MVRPLKLKFSDARNHAFQHICIDRNDVSNITQRQTEHGSYQYRYDHLDRLSQAEIVRFSYDPFGRRIRKTVSQTISQASGQGGASTPLGTITYLYADEGLLAEADISGNITTTYGWIPNGIWGTAPQWKAEVTLGGNTGNSSATLTYHYFHNDHLGSSQRLTNDQGVLTWSARMEAFGKTTTIDSIITNLVNGQSQTALMPTTTVNNLRFPGQIEDNETNTHYNYFRDYQASTGRYLQSDPIGLTGGINFYNYVRGNPAKKRDPWGLRPLSSCEIWTLSPYADMIDLLNADLHDGKVPFYLQDGFAGITRGNDIYFRPNVYDAKTPDGLAILAHELLHVKQYREGMNLLSYGIANRNGYRNNKFEVPAYELQGRVEKELTDEYGDVPVCP